MAIVKMNKFTLLTFESKKEELLRRLQGFSNVEFINLQDENLLEANEELKSLSKDEIDSNIAKYEEDLSKAKIALVTSGGIVPKGNPDHIESSSASKFGKYSLEGFEKLSSSDHQTAHGGYDPVYANDDPNRVLPVDVMREFEKEGVIGELHKYYYATVGNGTSVANAKKYASTFAKELVADGVDAVILTST